jgi:hypothetical protein
MSTAGPDGFPLAPDDRLYAAHVRLGEFLIADRSRDPDRTPIDGAAWKKLPKRQIVDLVEAILRRLTSLWARDREIGDGHLSRRRLIDLLRLLYRMKLPLGDADLRMMLDLTAPLLDRIGPEGPVEYVMAYLRDGDLTRELAQSLRAFDTHFRRETGTSASLQTIRQNLHVLLWLDEWEPLDPARCWSEVVRRDLRTMEGERRVHWRRLLTHIRGNAPVRMPASWASDGERRLAAVGLEDFCDQLAIWFAPFRSGQPLPLSVAGSHVLKGLIWYAALTRDQDAKTTALGLLDVTWKQKRNADKSMVALEVLGISTEDLRARRLLAPERAAAPSLLERFLKARLVTPIDHMVAEEDGDLIVVQGELHFYRLFKSSCRIERATDNAVLELDWHALPDGWRTGIARACDSEAQLRLRGLLLMQDASYGRYFRLVPAP